MYKIYIKICVCVCIYINVYICIYVYKILPAKQGPQQQLKVLKCFGVLGTKRMSSFFNSAFTTRP